MSGVNPGSIKSKPGPSLFALSFASPMKVMKKGLILRDGFALQNRLMVRMKYRIDKKDYGGILPRCQTRRETQSKVCAT